MSRARHRRPSRAVSIVTTTAPVAVAGAIAFTAPSAHAQVLPPPPASTPVLVSTDTLKPLPRAIAALTVVTVHAGQSLSSIAEDRCGTSRDWSGIAAANHHQVKNPNLIYPDEKLVLDCRTAHVRLPALPVVSEAVVQVNAPQRTYHRSYTPSGTYRGSGWHQQCIISHESGGNSQVMNASGHYGLYQFSESTWIGSGGSAAEFGHASVSEQNRVFGNAVAARGYSDWDPYDGC